MQKYWKIILVTAFLTSSPTINASGITNGDFQTGDFSGWQLDTDGALGVSPDFQIINNAGNYSARIEADAADDEVYFANTLIHSVDLSNTPGNDLILKFDWSFYSSTNFSDEYFLVGMHDGTGNYYNADKNLGFLFYVADNGSGTFSTNLNAFENLSGWTLEFQLLAGIDGEASHITLDNVSLSSIPQQTTVPLPGSIVAFISGLFAMLGLNKRKAHL